jgi:hypothetical protein
VGSSAIEDIVARYAGPRFGFASKNFYAEFLAALKVVQPLLASHGVHGKTATRAPSAKKPERAADPRTAAFGFDLPALPTNPPSDTSDMF